jgi:hypothetical protein
LHLVPAKAAVNAPHSKRFAKHREFSSRASVWSAVALAPLSYDQKPSMAIPAPRTKAPSPLFLPATCDTTVCPPPLVAGYFTEEPAVTFLQQKQHLFSVQNREAGNN